LPTIEFAGSLLSLEQETRAITIAANHIAFLFIGAVIYRIEKKGGVNVACCP
jgi:hypothetical protein